MLTTEEAFVKFRSRLELNEKEQANASRRQQEIRGHMDECFDVDAQQGQVLGVHPSRTCPTARSRETRRSCARFRRHGHLLSTLPI